MEIDSSIKNEVTLSNEENKITLINCTEAEVVEIQKVKSMLIKHESQTNESFSSYSDMSILRFIRGRNHDLDKAFRALMKNREWRIAEKVESISEESFISESKQGKLLIEGRDINNRPILKIVARHHNKTARDLEVIKLYLIHTLETIMKKTNPKEEKLTLLFDLEKVNMNCIDYEAVKLIVSILQYNYPETLADALILNAPYFFSACWMIIKLWIDPVTAAKVKFVSSAELSKYIEKETVNFDETAN